MAEEKTQEASMQPTTDNGATQEQPQFVCTGDCLSCTNGQRQYCACQMTYNLTRSLQAMQNAINAMAASIEELKAKVAAIQEEGDAVFAPASTDETDIAQNGQRRKK